MNVLSITKIVIMLHHELSFVNAKSLASKFDKFKFLCKFYWNIYLQGYGDIYSV
jgi:hypothetical protein